MQEKNDKSHRKCSYLSSPTRFRQNGRFMGTSFSPTRQDVERYRTLRALSMALNHRIIKAIPRQAYAEIGDALGIRRNGILVFDSADMTSVMMDCCLYNWFENGKNLVQRYAEMHLRNRERMKATYCRHASKPNIGYWWRNQQYRAPASTVRMS